MSARTGDVRETSIRIAGVQMVSSTAAQGGNVERALYHARRAVESGAQLIVLQEFFATGGFTWSRDKSWFAAAEPLNGPTLRRFGEFARGTGVFVVVPIFERDESCRGRFFNTSVIVGPSGDPIGLYRKQFVPVNDRTYEGYYFAKGNLGSPVFPLCPLGLQLGVCMCFDRHFGEVPRILATRGADLIAVPTSTNRARSGREEIWLAELVTMATSVSSYVIGVNSCGFVDGKDQFGLSAIVSPDGTILASLGEEEDILLADISPSIARTAKLHNPVLTKPNRELLERLKALESNVTVRPAIVNSK